MLNVQTSFGIDHMWTILECMYTFLSFYLVFVISLICCGLLLVRELNLVYTRTSDVYYVGHNVCQDQQI